MVNMGRIHRELGKFLMISLNLIKSDDELIIEIGENDILWNRTSRRFHRMKNHQIWLWFLIEIEDQSEMIFFYNLNRENTEIKDEIKLNY